MKHYVIIGGGPAGANAAIALRKNRQDIKISIISNENYVYYKRSKIIDLISASCTEGDLFLEGKEVYDQRNINFINGIVKKIIPQKNQIIMDNGSSIHYDFLLIATGGSPIIFPWKGNNLKGVSSLYTLDDAKSVSKLVCDAKKAVIVGGGSIAMKVIKNLVKIGIDTTIIEKASHLWPIGFDRKVARIVEDEITKAGVKIYLNEEVLEFKGKQGKINSVLLRSGKEIPTDLAIITIGMRPNIEFLRDSGVIIDKGVIVNDYLQTNIPNIFAAGDVAQIYDPLYHNSILHPTWGNAKKQGKLAALNMIGIKKKYEGTIPIQTIKIFNFKAIAAGITHSKKNFDEISLVSFDKSLARKYVLKNDKLLGILTLGKNLNKKKLKPLIKWAVFNMVDISDYKNKLLDFDFDFNLISNSSTINV